MKGEFNRYCARVENYNYNVESKYGYNPYENTNQSMIVAFTLMKRLNRNLLLTVAAGKIQDQVNNFIISTMDNNNETPN